jgi:hypothetical protein
MAQSSNLTKMLNFHANGILILNLTQEIQSRQICGPLKLFVVYFIKFDTRDLCSQFANIRDNAIF